MATYTPGSASDLESLDSIKNVQEYLIKQERKLDYMFNNLDPAENYSEQARLIMVEDGERQASIEVSLNQIALNYVSKSGVVSAINLSEEMIQIEASKIKLEGMVTVNGYFKVGLDGSIEAKNGKFSGDISASNITGSHIYASYYGVKDQDDFYIVDMGDYTEIGFAGFEGWGDKIFRSYTMGDWTNPASNDSSRIALNSNNGAAGFTTLYLAGLGDRDVANAIRSTVSGSDDEHDGSDGTEPDPNPQDPPEDPDVMHFDHIEVRNDLPAEPQALRTALRSTPTPITKTYDMLALNGVKGWIRDSWARRKIVAIDGAGYQTSADVSAAIAAAIGGITELEYLVVSALPASGTKGVIYLVPHSHGTSDIYDEYIWVNNTFEKIGNTDVDLSQYLLKTDIATWAKQPTKPTYTASEVGALPDTTPIPSKTSDLTNDSGFITDSDVAADNALGLMKTNSAKSITLNASNQLEVGGRMGQFPTTTGIYAPDDRDPRNVGNYSFLVTDAMGMDLDTTRSMALVSGYPVTCKSANAGATEYHLSNTYENRIYAKCADGGYAALDEATSTVQRIVPVVSVQINGADYTPNSDANKWSATDDIVIKTEESLNPTAATTNIRLFGKMSSFASFHVGNGIASGSGGRSLMLGGGVTKASGNDNCMVGMGLFSSGNGNAMFGRFHIAKKNRGFFAGTGHDSSDAQTEAVSAVGQYSYIDSHTLFAVGNGTGHRARSNAFEVTTDGGVILRDSNGGRWKITVDTSGNLTTTAVT